MREQPSSRDNADRLVSLVAGRERALIMTHDNPDPDAMAAALCLAHLVESVAQVKTRIVYGGIVGRAENRNMVRLLEIPLWSRESIRFRADDVLLMVDTQPGFGNNVLPQGPELVAVLDHHTGEPSAAAPLTDVRPHYGAVTTMAMEYLEEAGVDIPSGLATAICYGISSETQDLGRAAHPADVSAMVRVFPLCDQRLLGRLRHPRRTAAFFVELARAIQVTRAGEGVAICHLAKLPSPDMAAEMADMLISLEGLEWVLCTGVYGGALILSVRASRHDADAGELLRSVVRRRSRAGGHGMVAGGSLVLEPRQDPASAQQELEQRFLSFLGRGPNVDLRPLDELAGVPPGDPTSGRIEGRT